MGPIGPCGPIGPIGPIGPCCPTLPARPKVQAVYVPDPFVKSIFATKLVELYELINPSTNIVGVVV
jgi:hypothetical protein